MEKIDEVVLELRRELEKSKHTNVYTGMYANRQLIRFQRFFFAVVQQIGLNYQKRSR